MENATFYSSDHQIPTDFRAFTSVFESDGEKSCWEFLDIHDTYGYPSILDLLTMPPPPPPKPELGRSLTQELTGDFTVTPATPNSSSISSSSNDEQPKADEKDDEKQDQDEQNAAKKKLKARKKNPKRLREPRFAFMTKSEVDHLDDGYRWRKYGQKAVKNSPFPRSYYRCTAAACGLKKRVERSSEDPTVVVTTYEGQHTHPCPVLSRGSFVIPPESSVNILGQAHQYLYQQQQPPLHCFHDMTPSLRFAAAASNSAFPNISSTIFEEELFKSSHISNSNFVRDDGLLQDMVPLQMQKEPKEE
ncbi:hypothetical protein Nepgr_030397 [Nepenthes gracilis]|uniref:WRKY domain-containing protein n=1 Tax=Nepenthes gracilis TaxID=150966 RepID=A0AAD3TG26_NEPGR|nr:hypothetical protein Nepgr_030397 [Nepenthes gracilis]